MFNSDWRSERIVHHCWLGCPCKSMSKKEVAMKAVAALIGLVFASRPAVPALSRWLKCSETSQWFLLASSIRNILPRSFKSLYGLHSKPTLPLQKACLELNRELRQIVQSSGNQGGVLEGSGDALFISEIPAPKVMRARALKSVSWLVGDSTLVDICISVCSTEPAEYLSAWLFKHQHFFSSCKGYLERHFFRLWLWFDRLRTG